jgi:uncharacterized protein (DUF488 family)
MVIYTIGHSTHPIEEFIDILKAYSIDCLVDVRTIAKSRYNPQFHEDNLPTSLAAAKIDYIHLTVLGGLRSTRSDSPNQAWRNKSFRGYADYMQTPEFAAGIDELLKIAEQQPTAIMCAEAVPWRCHRSLIGDALLVRGVDVQDIMTKTSVKSHAMTSFAKVQGQNITYPADD